MSVNLHWIPQPAAMGSLPHGAQLAGRTRDRRPARLVLRGWNHLRFEITEEPTSGAEGARFSYTPDLGIFHAVTGLHGDTMIPEDRLKAAVVKAALRRDHLAIEIDRLLGKP